MGSEQCELISCALVPVSEFFDPTTTVVISISVAIFLIWVLFALMAISTTRFTPFIARVFLILRSRVLWFLILLIPASYFIGTGVYLANVSGLCLRDHPYNCALYSTLARLGVPTMPRGEDQSCSPF